MPILELILTSALAFIATNIDDLFLLTLFFGDRHYKSPNIYIGQIMGIGVLIGISIIISYAGNFISPVFIGFLGLFPIYLGVKQLFNNEDEENENISISPKNMIIGVALVTIANGGDNVGVYVPLFAALSSFEKIGMVGVFLLMTLLWCVIANYLSNHPLLKLTLSKYGHRITPFILILLGIYLLYENKTLSLLF
ncbi:cadmium resistance transporter [Pseudochryseolinea flava]|uniref:cadmium resistance transporter n=1 Tax=Pseudochryseolinea flava TaxID=2059302 RepID=UPI00140221AC|nr:cadmium resistance transporter [Pseudochryseolinea flava]